MKILVYGAGVLGCNLARNLFRVGKNVTLLARGKRAEEIKKNGLRIKDKFSLRTSVSHIPVVTELAPDAQYDVIFVVLRYTQLDSALDTLRANLTKNIAFVGNNVQTSKEKQYHLQRQILPGIAAYETLQRVMPKEEALQTVHGYVEELARTSHKQLAALLHIPGLYRLVPGVFVKSTRSVFGPAAGFDSKELQVGNGIWRVDMMKCPYHDTCVAYGCPELCCCFCDSDDISYTGLHPKLIWHRTKTLANGGAYCDYFITGNRE